MNKQWVCKDTDRVSTASTRPVPGEGGGQRWFSLRSGAAGRLQRRFGQGLGPRSPGPCFQGHVRSGSQRPPSRYSRCRNPCWSQSCPAAAHGLRLLEKGPARVPDVSLPPLWPGGFPEHVPSGLSCRSWFTEVNGQGQRSCLLTVQRPPPQDLRERRMQSSSPSTRDSPWREHCPAVGSPPQ